MMKKLLILCVGMLIGLASTWAQDAATLTPQAAYEHYNSPEYLAGVATNHLISVLDLTGEQREKIYCAKLTYLQHKRALIQKHKSNGGSSMAARLQLYEYRKTCNREIRAALKPNQIGKFDQYLAQTEQAGRRN